MARSLFVASLAKSVSRVVARRFRQSESIGLKEAPTFGLGWEEGDPPHAFCYDRHDSPQGTPVTAHSPSTDFEALGRQVWEAWSRQWAGAAPAPAAAPPVPGMDGLKSYLDWMQQATSAVLGQHAHGLPPMPPFAPWAMPGGSSSPPGLDALRELLDAPAFGYGREQQAQQQALLRALLDHQQASARYQQLIARAQAEGAERLQRKLAEPGFSGTPSLKAMYDLWVDAVEEAYAEIALSDEFREAYAAQANTQMRVRQLQQQQMEQWCREAGLPTRSEVATLGQRLQELRREVRRMQGSAGKTSTSGAGAVARKAKPSAPGKTAARASSKPATKSTPPARTPGRSAARKPR